ncbi:MAG: hypothetical protein HY646_15005, partial [Acidobacteria bacterium]|nr:hypothetical protein [Acidobacteriota bacterium]
MLKKNLLIGLILLLTLVRLESPFGAENGLTIPVDVQGLSGSIFLGLDGAEGTVRTEQFGNTTVYTTPVYRVSITISRETSRDIVRVRIRKNSGDEFLLNSLGMQVRVPRNVISGIWSPAADVTSTNIMSTDGRRSFNYVADANYGIPYIGAASSTLNNILALGFGRQDASVTLQGDPVENGLFEFRLRMVAPRTATLIDEHFYVSNDITQSWFTAAANYADWVDTRNSYRPFPISDRVFEPVYDTWYWSADHVNETLYLDTARIAAEVGAGLYLADSGWDAPAGEYDKWLNGRTGDYNPPPDKFPNLARTFHTIRSEYGLGVQLWLQPFAVGRASERYAATSDLHIHLPQKLESMPGWNGIPIAPFALPINAQQLETVNLCPRAAGTEAYFSNLFTEMVTEYAPDGFWLDFMDGVAANCTALHEHRYETFGEGFRRSLETMRSRILAANPDAVVHFRAPYANLNTKQFANVWQSQDSPGDFDRMRLDALRLRPFSQGVIFASDQLYWPENTSEVDVARFIMTSVMTGVPAFGPNLDALSPAALTMLKNWLRFYRAYKYDLALGRLT